MSTRWSYTCTLPLPWSNLELRLHKPTMPCLKGLHLFCDISIQSQTQSHLHYSFGTTTISFSSSFLMLGFSKPRTIPRKGSQWSSCFWLQWNTNDAHFEKWQWHSCSNCGVYSCRNIIFCIGVVTCGEPSLWMFAAYKIKAKHGQTAYTYRHHRCEQEGRKMIAAAFCKLFCLKENVANNRFVVFIIY